MMADYNPMELMICIAARNLEDGAGAAVGSMWRTLYNWE